MRKVILSWDFLFVTSVCFFGGLLDGYSFAFRNNTFCLVQTGNLVKSIVYFINGKIQEASYALILVASFILFIFVFYFVFDYLKRRNINYHFVFLPLIGILFIPSIIWKFNDFNYLCYQNIISGILFSSIGSIIIIIFRDVHFHFDKKITFNAGMMTGNMYWLMHHFFFWIKNKDSERGVQALIYFLMILLFSFAIVIVGLLKHFINSNWDAYAIFIIFYVLIVLMIITFHYHYQWQRKK